MDPLKRIANNVRQHVKAGFRKAGINSPAARAGSISSENHLGGLKPGKVVFFVLSKLKNGYQIRLSGKIFTLQTKQPLVPSRTYAGTLLSSKGTILRMAAVFNQINRPEGLSALFQEYSPRILSMFLRNGFPLKDENIRKMTAHLKDRNASQDEEDLIIEALDRNLLYDGIIGSISEKNQQNDSGQRDRRDWSEDDQFDMKDVVKESILRKKGKDTPLQLYNHMLGSREYHWVHIPIRLQNESITVEGYVRLQFDLNCKKLIKTILSTSSDDGTEVLCEISETKQGYVLKGNVPDTLLDKKLGSNRKIVDILKRYRDTYTGLSFEHVENASGVDVDA